MGNFRFGERASARNQTRTGFTLIEVMLALAIITIGMVVMIQGASRCLAVIKATKIYEDARHLIAQVEVENPIMLEDLEADTESGRFSGKYEGYSWTREITNIGEEEDDGLFQIRMRITWSEKGRKPYEEVVTYVYAPQEEDL